MTWWHPLLVFQFNHVNQPHLIRSNAQFKYNNLQRDVHSVRFACDVAMVRFACDVAMVAGSRQQAAGGAMQRCNALRQCRLAAGTAGLTS